MEKKLVGIDVTEKSVKLEGQDVVGSVSAQHVGKIGSLEITIKGKFQFLPLVNKGIDWVEEMIPGDQKAFATMAKEAISKIKIKF